MSTSSVPNWFQPLSEQLIARVDPSARPAMQAAQEQIANRLAVASPEQANAIRNRFAVAAMDTIISAMPPEALAIVSSLPALVGDAADALLSGVEDLLAPLQEAADQLREAADLAWAIAREPANAVASLLKAEDIAAIAAAATGLPPVAAAWATAAHARTALRLVSETAAKAAMAADAAWSSVVRMLDEIREQAFDAISSVADMAQGVIDSVTSIANEPVSDVAQRLSDRLIASANFVLPES
jgi:hypothetical protein